MTRQFIITYHPKVGDDFDLIDEFIASYADESVADKIVGEIRSTISRLEDFPHKGSLRNDIVSGLRALPAAEKKAVICFTVNDQMHVVNIVCVTYAGQDWQTIVKSRAGK